MSNASNRTGWQQRADSRGSKDAILGLAVIVGMVVVTVSLGFSLLFESRSEHIAQGVTDETGAVTLAEAVYAAARAKE